jgi:ABC-2 type transport system permease protein
MFQQGVSLAAIWVVMSQIPSLNGWNMHEVWLIYGLVVLGQSIAHMFADNLWVVGWQYIRPGIFDRFMVRPINPLFHLLADRFCHDGIGHFIFGTILVGYSLTSLGITLTFLRVLYLLSAVFSSGLIFISLNLLTASTAFFIVESIPITQMVFNVNEFARYPLTIYHPVIQFILTWIIPFGFASFYPASYLLGRDTGILAWLSPLVAIILLFISYRVWLFGLRHYTSTGT